jgi:hypothetical protein
MMKKIIFSQILFGLALLIFAGCKKKHSEEFLGPNYNAASTNLTVDNNQILAYNVVKSSGFSTGSPVGSVNIATNYQYYKASFSEEVRWKLTISSWKSRGVKVFTGFGNFIDSTNAKWDGSSDNDYFFGFTTVNDSVEVKLSFIGSDLIVRDSIRIINMKNYHDTHLNGIYHYLIDDGESTNIATKLSSFYPDAADLGGGNTGNSAYNDIKVQGDYSYRMMGTDVNNNTYLGSCNTETLNGIPPNTFEVTDPDQMFINLYVYGTGKPNTTVSVIAYENDANYAAGETFEQDVNDKYIYQVGVTWTGWKLVSFRYSAFKKPNTGGGLGNNQRNPERLSGMALELDSYPTAGFNVEACVDMLVVTEYGTFQK